MSTACSPGSASARPTAPLRTDPDAVPPGAAPGATRASIARAAGVLVYALIIIPFAIAALQVLGIEAISGPATAMLNQILRGDPATSSRRRCGSASRSSPRAS